MNSSKGGPSAVEIEWCLLLSGAKMVNDAMRVHADIPCLILNNDRFPPASLVCGSFFEMADLWCSTVDVREPVAVGSLTISASFYLRCLCILIN